MKAAIYQGKQDILMSELATPIAKGRDIVVKNLYASICGTDVAVYQHGAHTGHKVSIGGEFGHEVVSKIVQVGEQVKDLHVGDIVYPYPLLAKGDPSRAGTLGGFSEYMLLPDATRYQQVYPISQQISIKTASLIEPFTVGCRAARRSMPKKGETAIVFGAGTIGIAAAIALKYFGCDQVLICDLSQYRLNIAKNLGFEVCNSGKEDLREKAMSIFGTAPSLLGPTANVDIFIDAAGAPELLDTFQHIAKIEARLVIVAVLSGMRQVDILSMTYAQHAIIGSGGYMPEDVTDVLHIMESNHWDIESIITHEFPWENLTQAIETASDTEHALNVVIKYQDL